MVTNSIKKQKRLKWSTLKKTKSLKKQATMTYLFTLHFLSQSKHGRLPVESCRPALLPCQRPLQVTHVLSNPAKTVTWICSREGKKNPNFQGPAFLLKVLFEGKFVFSFTFYIFDHVVRSESFLMTPDDQTSLRSSLCPTSDFTCGVIMFIMISEEKNILWKKSKKSNNKTVLFWAFCVCT